MEYVGEGRAAKLTRMPLSRCRNGGLYSASAYLVPKKYRAPVGWIVGWLNLLGQVSAIASVEFALSGMVRLSDRAFSGGAPAERCQFQIMSAVSIGTNGDFVATNGQTVGLFVGELS